MIPAKNGMFVSYALVDGRNTEGGGALENGKASTISAQRSSSRPMRCNEPRGTLRQLKRTARTAIDGLGWPTSS